MSRLDELRAAARLAVHATLGIGGVVEELHRTVASGPAGILAPVAGPLTSAAYRPFRAVTGAVGRTIDAALAQVAFLLQPLEGESGDAPWREREAAIAALNGVLGDFLEATATPLAVQMRLRSGGVPLRLERDSLRAAFPSATGKIAVLVHGSAMGDLQWRRKGRDLGAMLAEAGFTPLYLNYNSGLHVSTNGRALSDLLEALVAAWPVPVDDLVLLGHSMGGLVARSACHAAALERRTWPRRLGSAVFLGTPHHGAPLEVGGSWLHAAFGVSPYSAPLARLGRIRSAGVTDLRHGSLLDEDWDGRDRFTPSRIRPRAVPLPEGVRWHAVAGTTSRAGRLLGDGLVPVDSALGRHRDPGRDLAIPPERTWIARGVNHFGLLGDPGVYDRIREWVREPGGTDRPARRAARRRASSGPGPSRHG